MHIIWAELGQASAGDNEVKLMITYALVSGFEPATQ